VAVPAIAALSPDGFSRLDQAGINAPVLVFAFLAAVLSALVAGIMPALRAARPDLVGVLKEGGRTAAISKDRLRTILVGAEVSIAIVLLVGAGLLVRSAINLQRVDTGFDPSGVLSARITLPVTGYEDPARVERTFETLATTLAASPGVEAAAITSNAPMTPGGNGNGLVPEGKVFDPNDFVLGRLAIVTQDYLRVMRIPVVAGRFFTPDDRRGAPKTMVLSETAARLLFPGQNAVGKRVGCCEPDASGGGPGYKLVVGIVGDVRNDGPQQQPLPNFYLPIAQAPDVAWTWLQRSMTVVVRGRSGDAAALTGALRSAVREMDATVPVYNIASMQQRLQTTLAPARFNTVLMLLLGAIGLFLASVGVYGVVAFFATARKRDLAIRVALGAPRGDVVRSVVGQGMKPVVAGVAVGLAAALAASRVLSAYVFGVGTTDPLTLTTVVVLLLAVALVAAAFPAMRAARVDPISALRGE
jgi:predicted permease